jgi:hypothetical protein
MKIHLLKTFVVSILFFSLFRMVLSQPVPMQLRDTLYLVPAQTNENLTDSVDTENIGILQDNSRITAKLDDFPSLHPLVVHFAISLIMVAALLQLINVFIARKELAWIIFFLLTAGFVAGMLASRNFHPAATGLEPKAEAVLELHYLWSVWTLRTAVLALGLQFIYIIITRKKLSEAADGTPQIVYIRNRGFALVIAIVMLVSAYCVARTGHYGAQLVHIEGVGPQGRFLSRNEGSGHLRIFLSDRNNCC